MRDRDSIYWRCAVTRIARSSIKTATQDWSPLRHDAWASLKVQVPASFAPDAQAQALSNIIKALCSLAIIPDERCLLAASVYATSADKRTNIELRDWGAPG